jgi:glycosyltransferase involved in cell wall biosynthesis
MGESSDWKLCDTRLSHAVEQSVRLLFDNRWLGKTGIGRYAEEILKRTPPGIEIVMLNASYPIKDPLTPLRVADSIRRIRPDVFWSPGFMPPLFSAVPFVFTIHDLMHLEFGTVSHRIYYNQIIRRLAKRAACVLTVSEYSRQQILDWSGIIPEKVAAIPLGISSAFSPDGPTYDLGRQYILYVGNRRVYKNLPRLIRAFSLANLGSDISLALTGDYDQNLHSLAADAGVSDRLVFLGNVPEEALPSLYRGALVLAYISLSEGFGLPPLEAMACGTPTVVSNTTSLPEVVGAAAIQVNPTDEASIASAFRGILNDSKLREHLRENGLKQAAGFSWVRCASSTWQRIVAAGRA